MRTNSTLGASKMCSFDSSLKMSKAFKILFSVIYSMSGPRLYMLEVTTEGFRRSSTRISGQVHG